MHDTFSPVDPLAAALPLEDRPRSRQGRGPLERGLRLLAVLALILIGVLMAVSALLLSPLIPTRLSLAPLSRFWHGAVLAALGLRVQVSGPAPAPGTLQVCNHISWVDILVLGAQQPMRFVAKAEVQQWPVIGALAAVAGTLFIRRGQRQGDHGSDTVRARLREALEAGECVAIFPEGTTTDGREVRKFHPRLFVSNSERHLSDWLTEHRHELQIQPVALRYGGPGREAAPFIGDDSFAAHLWRLLGAPSLDVELKRLPVLPALESLRAAERAREQVCAALGLPRTG